MRIRILLLIKVMRICDTGLQTLHSSILSLYNSKILALIRIRIQLFTLNANPDPAFKNNADRIRNFLIKILFF
jgi:hypothetical protein